MTFGLFCLGKCLGRDYSRILIGHGFAWYHEGATLQKMRYRGVGGDLAVVLLGEENLQ